MTKEILIRGHLGLGDGLVANALVRHFAQDHDVTVICKPHNQTTMAFMFRDCLRIALVNTQNDRKIDDDALADAMTKHVKEHGKRVLCLGMYGDRAKFDPKSWDRSFYNQAGLDFQLRWNEFKCARQPSGELGVPRGDYAFVHDDPSRGFGIPQARLPQKLKIVKPEKGQTDNLFAYWGLLENAREIHLIDSSFAILADSLPDLKAERVCVHLYARAGALPPSYRKDFEMLRL